MWFKTPKLEAVLFLPIKNYWWLVVELKQWHKITPKYTGPNLRKSNTLRHFEAEVVRECFIKELGMLNPFLGSAKVKNAYFVWYLKIFNMADKMLLKILSAQCADIC